MVDLTCGLCGYSPLDENETCCINCGGNPHQTPAECLAQSEPPPRVTVLVATARVVLDQGEKILLGRQGDPRFTRALEEFDNVGREHVEITAGEGIVVALPRNTTNGTFIGDRVLPPGEERNIALPVTIRLARNCYVHFEVAHAHSEVIDE